MKFRFQALVGGLLFLVLASTSSAFDGDRKGFVFGAGFGAGYTSYERSEQYTSFEHRTWKGDGPGFSLRLEAGYCWDPQFVFAWEFQSLGYTESQLGSSSGVFTVTSGPSMSYYFRPESKGAFIGGGPALILVTDELNIEILGGGPSLRDAWGLALTAKGGYEFSPHFDLSLGFIIGSPTQTSGQGYDDATLWHFTVTVNWLGY